MVKLLVACADIEVDMKDKYGCSPLSYAAADGHEVVVKLLVPRGDIAELNSKNKDGHLLLSYATQYGHEAMVKILVAWDNADSGRYQA